MLYPIKLDKERNFKYGMRAIDTIEKKFKKDIHSVFANVTPTMEHMSILLWAGLKHEDETLSPDKVMDLVDEHSNLKEVTEKMYEALGESLGMKKEEPSAGEEPEKNAENTEETPENPSA